MLRLPQWVVAILPFAASLVPLAAKPTPEIGASTAVLPPNDHFAQPESTKRMSAMINAIYASADPLRNWFRNSEQVPLLREKEQRMLQANAEPSQIFDLQYQIGLHLLQSGRPEEALQQFHELEQFLRSQNQPLDGQMGLMLLTGCAMSHLRIGEVANCLAGHNADSCLFPIKGGGVHKLTEGSRNAIAVLNEMLTRFPNDLRGRWLLNIAYMTLGEYPDKVPARWRIDPKFFASDYDIQRFPDVAAQVGLDVDSLAGGVVLEDLDGDGLLDVVVSAWGFTSKDQIRAYRNLGNGFFEERTKQAGLVGLYSGLNLNHTDYNNDGFPDILVMRGGWLGTEGHYPFSLLRNNGDFTFTDVTEESGLISHRRPTQSAAWFDYNGDGWLDLFVANESSGREANACELFRNNGDGTFTECAAEFGVVFVGYYKGVTSGDYNNDGRPDLFLSNREGNKILLRNDGPAETGGGAKSRWRFTDVTEAAGIVAPPSTFPCWFFDYDNDGWLDLMVTGYSIQNSGDIAADYLGRPHPAAKTKLFRNNRDGTFEDVSRAAGVSKLLHAMGVNFGDLDNDGWLDFYVGTGDPELTTLIPSRMFRNDGNGRFQDVTTSGGFGQLQKGHGIAFGDIDNDGDQDIYSVVGGAVEADSYRNQLFANPGHGNRWFKLQLQGVQSNRAAIGVRLKIVVSEAGRERAIYRVVSTGATFGSGPLRQDIGLGQADRIIRVEIFWPVTGQTQVLEGFEPGGVYRVVEGRPGVEALKPAGFDLQHLPAREVAGHRHHH